MTATTTTQVAPAAGTAAPALPTRIYGVAAVLAAILLVASTIAFILRGGFTNDAINNGVFVGTLVVWTIFALILSFAGVSRLIEPRFRRSSKLLLILSATYAASVGLRPAEHRHGVLRPLLRRRERVADRPAGHRLLRHVSVGRARPGHRHPHRHPAVAGAAGAGLVGIALIAGGALFIPGREGNIGITVVTDVLLFVGLLAAAQALPAAANRGA